MKAIRTCLPHQIAVSRAQLSKIAHHMVVRQISQKYSKLEEQEGIFLFFEGIFMLCHNNSPVLEVENNFA